MEQPCRVTLVLQVGVLDKPWGRMHDKPLSKEGEERFHAYMDGNLKLEKGPIGSFIGLRAGPNRDLELPPPSCTEWDPINKHILWHYKSLKELGVKGRSGKDLFDVLEDIHNAGYGRWIGGTPGIGYWWGDEALQEWEEAWGIEDDISSGVIVVGSRICMAKTPDAPGDPLCTRCRSRIEELREWRRRAVGRVIVRAAERCYLNPEYAWCQRRLRRGFEQLMQEAGG